MKQNKYDDSNFFSACMLKNDSVMKDENRRPMFLIISAEKESASN